MSCVDDELVSRAVSGLRAKPRRLHVIATGAGAGIQQALWEIPGASDFLAGAQFPYAKRETVEVLGYEPESFVSRETAIALAMAAYMRAFDPSHPENEPVGLGVTAAVASARERRGESRAFLACMTRDRAIVFEHAMPRGHGALLRGEQGCEVDHVAIDALRVALGPRGAEDGGSDAGVDARRLLFARPYFAANGRRRTLADLPERAALFPGAFDPPHEGHLRIAQIVDKRNPGYGGPIFTICATPPHKPALTVQNMLERAVHLRERPVLFTEGDPLYVDKAARFPGRLIVIGADALLRMRDPRWGTVPKELAHHFFFYRTVLLVFGRMIDGHWVSAEEAIGDDGEWISIADPIDGRWDVSSSELRGRTLDTR